MRRRMSSASIGEREKLPDSSQGQSPLVLGRWAVFCGKKLFRAGKRGWLGLAIIFSPRFIKLLKSLSL